MRRTECGVVVAVAVAVMLAGCRTAVKVNMEDALRWDNPIRYITSGDVRGITKGMTYGAIVTRLGPTRDVGSGLHVALYIVDRAKSLYLSFAGLEQICSRDGAELLQSLEATDFSMIGITGVVKNIKLSPEEVTGSFALADLNADPELAQLIAVAQAAPVTDGQTTTE